ncbi:hypothetical protein CRE_25539 [Caenorhabditis remanei]|uniref:GYF domain-containing protein n=1 Tax=Caenorhabditis remanei TaxID=31234 RepID=E3LS54_CAERE|nr:hypothetical protein CRE_25539 [Caenorhabditis remanei]
MSSECRRSENLYRYSYIDLEGNKYGPFEGSKMTEWDANEHLDDELIIFRISASGKTEKFILDNLRRVSKTPFLETDPSVQEENKHLVELKSESPDSMSIESSCFLQSSPAISPHNSEENSTVFEEKIPTNDECQKSSNIIQQSPLVEALSKKVSAVSKVDLSLTATLSPTTLSSVIREPYAGKYFSSTDNIKNYNPDIYPSHPFMRLPDSRFPIIKLENARAKVFSLYQFIITVPKQLMHFPPYTTETAACQLCRIDLTGPDMFKHLINIQHLSKISNSLFTENDVDFWIDRVNNVIKQAPSSALILPGFNPEMNLNESESITGFINRTKGFVRNPNLAQIEKVIEAVLNVTVATFYSSSTSKSKRKVTGKFLSQVVEALIVDVDQATFQRRYQRLMKKHNTCTFCNTRFESFYEACSHIGTPQHSEKINNVLYQEGLVATLVRILARAALSKRASRLQARNLSYSSSVDIITVD